MRIVTIARQLGARGSEVARLLAWRLTAGLVDDAFIEEVSRRAHLSSEEVAAEDERPRRLSREIVGMFATAPVVMSAAWLPVDFDDWPDPRRLILDATREVIEERARQGNVVIVGRGAAFALHHRTDVRTVLLSAPVGARIEALMERSVISESEARRRVRRADANLARYIHEVYGADWLDPSQYDLTLNPLRLGEALSVDIIRASLGDLSA